MNTISRKLPYPFRAACKFLPDFKSALSVYTMKESKNLEESFYFGRRRRSAGNRNLFPGKNSSILQNPENWKRCVSRTVYPRNPCRSFQLLGLCRKAYRSRKEGERRDLCMEYLWAFIVGGAICVVGQVLIDFTKLTPARICRGGGYCASYRFRPPDGYRDKGSCGEPGASGCAGRRTAGRFCGNCRGGVVRPFGGSVFKT